mmetsp:Transcript_56363/g.150077  ORF Transcript_56363/g.150077 Transcript_56363/m.150077 type:complete len:273 (-) Transcript_56363:392-1210(-)
MILWRPTVCVRSPIRAAGLLGHPGRLRMSRRPFWRGVPGKRTILESQNHLRRALTDRASCGLLHSDSAADAGTDMPARHRCTYSHFNLAKTARVAGAIGSRRRHSRACPGSVAIPTCRCVASGHLRQRVRLSSASSRTWCITPGRLGSRANIPLPARTSRWLPGRGAAQRLQKTPICRTRGTRAILIVIVAYLNRRRRRDAVSRAGLASHSTFLGRSRTWAGRVVMYSLAAIVLPQRRVTTASTTRRRRLINLRPRNWGHCPERIITHCTGR